MIPKRTPISYYGGKQRMLSDILPMIPKHHIYCEPYFGGGAVFFAKPPSKVEVINDTNGNVVNFYQVMQSEFCALNELVSVSLYSEQMHVYALKIYKSKRGYSKVQRAWAFWFVLNFSYANKAGGGWKFDNATDGSHIGVTFARKKFEFVQYAKCLQKVQISNRDALKVIKERNKEDTFFFLDPPYVDTEQGHYKGFKQKDLDALIQVLPTVKGKWMLCHNANEALLRACAKHGWYNKGFDMRNSVVKEANRRKTEIIITNYQPYPSLFEDEKTTLGSINYS